MMITHIVPDADSVNRQGNIGGGIGAAVRIADRVGIDGNGITARGCSVASTTTTSAV